MTGRPSLPGAALVCCLLAWPCAGLAAPLAEPPPDLCVAPATATGAPSAETVTLHLPDVRLQPAQGASVSLGSQLRSSEAVLLNFIYTSCTSICPPMAQIFAATQERLGSRAAQVQMLSISIDPEHDSPRRLQAYARRFGAGTQWRFFTGSLQAIDAVQRAFSVWRPDKMSHTPVTFIKPRGQSHWWRVDGFATPDQLIALALPEAGAP